MIPIGTRTKIPVIKKFLSIEKIGVLLFLIFTYPQIYMKNINDICFIISARLNSQRVPQKMVRPFHNSNLFEI